MTDNEKKELSGLSKAFLVGVYLSGSNEDISNQHLEELKRLCDTYGLEVLGSITCSLKKIDSAIFIGSGKLQEIKQLAEEAKADVIIFDDEISPQQQRNLEKEIKKPVIDRTELILEVFAKHAKSREARLQIELAKIRYQMPRLKRLWTHLSRQSSGGGGGAHVKGEGEKQIEIDKRILKARITRLQKDLEEVKEQRGTQRRARLRSQIPSFAIVGYTNAGKSTLLKALTDADVLVEDKLFATLDTTTRKFTLPNRQEIVLVDTVGFIRKIPHTVVAAFRSTLEEVLFTDIILHLIDVSHPSYEEQAAETQKVLEELGAKDIPIITVLNKIDACRNPFILHKMRLKYHKTVAISALQRTGFDELMELMIKELANLRKVVKLRIPMSHYALVSELNREGKVLSCEYEENDVILEVAIPTKLEYKVMPFLFGETV